MKTYFECIPCIINQGIHTARRFKVSDENTEILVKKILSTLSEENLQNTPPYFVKSVHRIIKNYLGIEDLYKDIKDFYNCEIMKIENVIKNQIEISENKFLTALKLSILGNIIDFGASNSIDKEKLFKDIANINKFNLQIDDSEKLLLDLNNAKRILYIADNCGEIVFDKIVIEYIRNIFKNIEVYVAVRGEPVINDVTYEDALFAGIENIAHIISNGDSAPGTIISNTTPEFREIFNSVDVIISKGQGNYESLSEEKKSNIYFLLMAKCSVIANDLNVSKMSLVCKKNK